MNIAIKSAKANARPGRGQYSTLLGGLFVLVLAATVMALVALSADRNGARDTSPSAQASAGAPRAASPAVREWKHLYYIVATAEQGDQIVAANARALEEMAVAGIEPRYALKVIVADTPESQKLADDILWDQDFNPAVVQYVDLRGSFRAGSGTVAPTAEALLPLEPDPCHVPIFDAALDQWVNGICQ